MNTLQTHKLKLNNQQNILKYCIIEKRATDNRLYVAIQGKRIT